MISQPSSSASITVQLTLSSANHGRSEGEYNDLVRSIKATLQSLDISVERYIYYSLHNFRRITN